MHIWSLILVYLAFLGAVLSPGPDFIMVLRNSLGHSAKAGIFTALGIAAGVSFHLTYCIAGLGLLISQSILLFNTVKWIGAAYLVYMGWGALKSKGVDIGSLETRDTKTKTSRQAFVNGLITNAMNPKATLFFVALFSQMLGPTTPVVAQVILGAACMGTAFVWFSLVSLVMGIPHVRAFYARISKNVDRVLGGFFIALGAKLALSSAR